MKRPRSLIEHVDRRLLLAAPPLFDSARYEFEGAYPQSVATGDFNEDGFADVATTYVNGTGNSGGVRILLNNGAGDFTEAANIPTHYPKRSFVAADFDSDGHLDLLTQEEMSVGAGYTYNMMLWGRGDGSFETPVEVFGNRAGSLFDVGDFNADQKPDIVLGSTMGLPVVIFYGNGTRSLAAPTFVAVPGGSTTAVVGDFNGDSRDDIAITGTTYLNDANGGFVTMTNNALPGNSPYATVADLNGDGFDDVIDIQSTLGIRIAFATGTGSFNAITQPLGAATPHDIAIADFNADGNLDIAVGVYYETQFIVLDGNGDGTFATPRPYSVGKSHYTWTIAADDFNNDGRTDLAMAHYTTRESSGSVSIVLNRASGGMGYAQPFSGGIARNTLDADINEDGLPDLLFIAQLGARIGYQLATSAGVFGEINFITLPGAPGSLATGDFNGDGHVDFAVAGTSYNAIHLGDGTTAFTAVPLTGFSSTRIAVGDFDDDGIDDAAFLGGTVRLTAYSGANTFSVTTLTYAGQGATRIASGDFDGDGKTDLVLGGGGTIYRLLRRTGSQTFAPAVTLAMPSGFDLGELRVDDINFDGRADLFASLLSSASHVRIYAGQSDGTLQVFGNATNVSTGGAFVTGDFDGDGRIDIAFPYVGYTPIANSGRLAIHRGQDDGTFAPRESFALNDTASYLHAADLDLDGRLDIITTNNVVTIPGAAPRSESILFNRLGPDTTPVAVRSGQLDLESAQRVVIVLDEPVDASSVSASDLIATNLTTGQTFAASSVAVTHNGTRLGFTFASLTDGSYQFTLAAGSMADRAGNASLAYALGGTSTFILAGDINLDRAVNFDDLLILAQNYGQSGRTYSQGNLNYSADGMVSFDDLLLLAQRYGTSLAIGRSTPAATKRRGGSADVLM